MAYRLFFGVTFLLLPFALVSQTAQFSASAFSGCAPLVVTFDASASQGAGPLSYQWSFGNGNSASGPTQGAPGAAYINPGVYTVTLTVTSITGQVSPPVSQTITVFANPVADFSFTPASGCPDLPVQLTDLSTPAGTTPISGWTWDFGDGGGSSQQNPVHSFGSGTYSLTLIAVDANGCQDVEVKPNVVYVSPGADISLSATGPLQTCNPTLSVPFQSALISTSPGPFSYDWHFGDGGTSTLAQPQHTYTAYGLYDVSLTLTDLSSGCAFSDTLPDFIRLLDQVVSATASVSGTCAPVAATFTQTSSLIQPGFVATWDFGDGSSQTGSATALGSVTHTYALPGTYLPVLTVDMGPELCIQSYALPAVQVAVAPSVQLLRSDSVACQPPLTVNFTSASTGDSAWLWTFGDGTSSTLQNPVHTYTAYGSYPVSLTVWNASGCSDSQQIPAAVRIIDPVAAFSHNLADFTVYPQYWDGRDPWPIRGGCLPLDITFADQSTSPTPIISYAWTFGDGSSTNTLNDSILHTYVTEGEFDVTLTITTSDGCVRADTCAPCIRAGNPPTALLDTTGYPTLSCCDPATLFINQTDTATHDYVWYAVTTGDWEGFVVNDSVNGNWDFSTIVPVFMDSGQYVSTMFYAYNFGCVDSFDLYHWTMLRPPWGAAGIDLLPCKSNWPPGGVVVFDTSLVSYVPDTSYIDSVLWEFGDPANSTSNELYPTFTYPDTGAYWITVTTWNFSIGCSCRVSGQQFLKIVVLPDTTFAVIPTQGCAPLQTSFTGPTANVSYWDWDVGLGLFSSTAPNPVFTFDSTGVYDVRLIVASADGCRDTVFRDDLIRVEGIVPRLAASDTVSCVPFTVTLTDQSIATAPIISRTWTLPDGTVLSGNSPTITHTFTQALQSPENQHLGLPVILSLSDSSGCSNSDTLTLYLFAPVPAYTADTLHQCNGDTLLLRAAAGDSVGAGNLSFAWWANGLTPDTLTGRRATLFVPWGTPWILSLSVTDSLGCTATLSDTLELEERRPQANFSAFPVQATCPPLLVHFTDLSIAGHAPIVSWNWNFGDGSSSLLAQPSKVFASQGVFGVSLSITDSLGCTDFFNIPDLIRLSGVDGSFQVSDDTICARDSVLFIASSPNAGSYTWDFGDGNLGFGQTFLHHYEFPGEIYPALVMEDPLGLCSVTLIDTMRIYPVPSVPLPIDTAFCEGGSATYNVQQPGAEYLWSTGAISPDITLTESGNYNVKIIFPESGCFGETNIALTVWPAPEVSLGADRVLCEGDTILVLAQSADTLTSYAWTRGTVLATGPDRRYLSPRSGTTLGVEVRDLRGCPGEDTIRIEVVPFPVINLAYDPLCIGDTLLLDATPTNFNPVGAEYFWLKDGTATGDLSPQIAITEEGLYEVWFTLQECRTEADTEVIFNPLPESDQYERIMNCVYKGEPVTLDAGEHWGYFWEHSGEFTRTVEVVDSSVYYFRVYNEFDCSVRDSIEVIDACPPKLYVPTAFTPNGDGHNEAFGWAGDYIGLFDMQIYSRWGMLLYQTNRLSDVWDATYSGEVVPEGVYVWRVVYNGTHPDWRHPQELAGTVTVFR